MDRGDWLRSILSIPATEDIFESLAIVKAQYLLVVAIDILPPNSKEQVLYHFILKEFDKIWFIGFLTHDFLYNRWLATH